MSSMFERCENLIYLETSYLNMSSALTTKSMFSDCYKLAYISIDKVANDSSHMFQNCYSLTSLDISRQSNNNITIMNHMFYNCSKLEYLDLGFLITDNAFNFKYMFAENYNLRLLNISSFLIDEDALFEGMFDGCDGNLTIIINPEKFNNKELLEIIENNFTVEYFFV